MIRTKGNKKKTLNVRADVRRQKAERKKEKQFQADIFKRIRPKTINFSKQPSMEQYVYLSKKKLTTMMDSELAVYIVLCCRAIKYKDWFQVSQENIAKMAGLSVITARKGIQKLIDRGVLIKKKINVANMHTFIYKIDFYHGDDIKQKESKGDVLQFYCYIVNGGKWSELRAEEKELYLVMRRIAVFEPEIFGLVEEIDLDGMVLDEFYQFGYSSRKWDVLCTEDSNIMTMLLSEYSYINPDKLIIALKRLEEFNLVEYVEDYQSCYKVYLREKEAVEDHML